MKPKSYCYYRSLMLLLMGVLLVSVISGCGGDNGSTAGGGASAGLVFFDDFTYSGNTDSELTDFGWYIRDVDVPGNPGYSGALWLKENVDFIPQSGNTVLQLSAAVSGSVVSHSEINFTHPFYEGTYAARIKFSDTPVAGKDGNYINGTFCTISQGKNDSEDYSECDFEYLPNRGWDGANPVGNEEKPTMYFTTWETIPEYTNLRIHDVAERSFDGWHLLTMTVMNGTVTYFIDGQEQYSHGGIYYPESPMVVCSSLWFLSENTTLVDSKYQQQVDWVYYCKDKTLTAAEVEQNVTDLRNQSVKRLNQITKN